ncbi:Centrosomal protein of 95 kDa [Trebouxia sp. C0010 RCD-2024]
MAMLSSTSVFVACCEALLGRKLQGIQRRPASAQERAENVQAVLWELSHNVLQTDLSHISGQGVVSQDPVDVHNLLEIFSALLTQETQHASTGATDQIPAVHNSLDTFKHVQHDGKTADLATSQYSAQLSTPAKLHPFTSNASSRHGGKLPVEAVAHSPASVRPKCATLYDAQPHAADDASTSSQCSQCLDAQQLDESQATAGHEQPQQQSRRNTSSACGRGAGSKRRVRGKRQGKKAPLVMSDCYAAAVRSVLQQQEEQTQASEASDRHNDGSQQRLEEGQGPLVDPTMSAKLAHLYSLSQDDPKSSQQRQRYEAARQQAEHQRVVLQKQVWLKQSLARRRVEAARQQQQLLLRSRAHAFHAKVDAIRTAQQEAEAAAAERSQQLRRVAAQEALLKDSFYQAVEAEKERLLLARERRVQGKASSAPQKCSGGARGDAQQGTEGWVDVLRQHCADLEVGLAQEHQHRVRQEREKALLQQAFRQDAIRREWKQHEARLVRVASLDYAAVFRSTHSAKQQQTLKHEFRQSIQISG